MRSPLEQAILDHLDRYLCGEWSLDEFDEWFVPATLDIDHSNDEAATDLTYEIILRFAEYDRGHRTEAELKDILRPLTEAAASTVRT